MLMILSVLGPLLPLIGKVLLMLPFVPNKAIPFIYTTGNAAAKYWVAMNLPTEGFVDPAPTTGLLDAPVMMAGIFGEIGRGAVGIVWGCAEGIISHYWYEGRKAVARQIGVESVWEKGKRSMW